MTSKTVENLPPMKLATLEDVREHGEHLPVELWLRNGRVVIRAYNECGNNSTEVDLFDLLHWTRGMEIVTLTKQDSISSQAQPEKAGASDDEMFEAMVAEVASHFWGDHHGRIDIGLAVLIVRGVLAVQCGKVSRDKLDDLSRCLSESGQTLRDFL